MKVPLFALIALFLALLAVAPAFFDPANLRDLFVAAAPVVIAAIGMTLVILTRHIDISIGSQLAFCAVVAGVLAKSGLPITLAGLGAVATGALIGAAANGPYYGYAPGYYGGPAYYGYGYGGCYWTRQRVWDGWGWRFRRVQVCG